MQTITILTDKGETIKVNGEITINGKPIEPPAKEKQYSWEKSFERVCVGKSGFFIDYASEIMHNSISSLLDSFKNTVPTESQAFSVLAYTQLKVITTDMNGTSEMLTPEMNGGKVYAPYYSYVSEKFTVGAFMSSAYPFAVRTRDLCQQLIDENTELLEQFYEIKK